MLKFEEWDINKLIPYARNPRKNDEQVDRMCSAIREFGFRIPIVAKSDGTVVDGHLRLKAAKKLKLDTVPVVLADDLTDTQIKAFRLLANQSANWAEWDVDLLSLELVDLRTDDFNLELIGFNSDILADYGIGIEGNDLGTDFTLANNSSPKFKAMTLSFSSEQFEFINECISKTNGNKYDNYSNTNHNGNAIYEIVKEWAEQRK